MTLSNVEKNIERLFKDNRVVFWYDKDKEFEKDYEELSLDGVTKVPFSDNPFYIKYLVTRKKPKEKFLLYFPFEQSQDENNWLLDLQLAHHVFHSDPAGMFLQALELQYELKPLVENHFAFFKSKQRRSKFKELYSVKDSYEDGIGKILAVVFNTIETNINSQLLQYADSIPGGGDGQITHDLDRFNLEEKFWERVSGSFRYESDNPSIYDFLLTIFNYHFPLSDETSERYESKILLSRWKETKGLDKSFEVISNKIKQDLQVEEKLRTADIEQVIKDDLFSLTDKRILSDMVTRLSDSNIPLEKIESIIKSRSNKYWYKQYEVFYDAVNYAALLFQKVKNTFDQGFSIKSLEDGAQKYVDDIYKADYHYRKFVSSYRSSKQNSILKPLAEKVEKVYSNDWLLPINNEWQKVVDGLDHWPTKNNLSQQEFFNHHIKPYTDKEQRLFVIVSDALRFEVAREFFDQLTGDHRFILDDHLSYAISSLPSYTQLGMASLLPHDKLTVQEESDSVKCDGELTVGMDARKKIIQSNSDVRSTAIGAEEFMAMHSKKEGRDFVKDNDLIYVYHNSIDKVGDDKDSEEKVFEAVEQELDFLLNVLVRINTIMPHSHVLVTADHGFIYQNDKLHESDFAVSDIQGDVWKSSRRFVIGKNLKGNEALTHFKGDQLGLQDDLDVLIPKSINRLRLRGAGSQFAHGGASLQETIVPIMTVSYKSGQSSKKVDIEIIKNSDKISTNILPVSFIQTDAVTETYLPRKIKAAIYAPDGEKLSDEFTYTFDFKQDSERKREAKHTFQISNIADKYYGKWVELKLEEPIEGSTKWKSYRQFSYQLITSFTNDFDEF